MTQIQRVHNTSSTKKLFQKKIAFFNKILLKKKHTITMTNTKGITGLK